MPIVPKILAASSLLAILLVAAAARADRPGPRLRASVINVFPQGDASVIVINKGSDAGLTMSDWVRHPRGVCRPSEIYQLRSKCVMPISSRDIGAIRELEIWSDGDLTPEQRASWTRSPDPEPEPPDEPPPWVRAPAPRLTVYRRFEDTRYTHECLGFTPDGAAAYLLTGGTRNPGHDEPLVLLRFAADGTRSEIPIAAPGAPTEASTLALERIRRREKLLACHQGDQKDLPTTAPADKRSTSWPVLASHSAKAQVFLWVDGRHLNALSGPMPTTRELMPVVLGGPDGDKTRPEDLGDVYYLPGAALHVLALHGWGSSRWVAVSVSP